MQELTQKGRKRRETFQPGTSGRHADSYGKLHLGAHQGAANRQPSWPSTQLPGVSSTHLEDLARHVEGQVGGVHHALDEGQVARHQVLVKLICRRQEGREGEGRGHFRCRGGRERKGHPCTRRKRSCCTRGQPRGEGAQGRLTGRRLVRCIRSGARSEASGRRGRGRWAGGAHR